MVWSAGFVCCVENPAVCFPLFREREAAPGVVTMGLLVCVFVGCVVVTKGVIQCSR
jgi:hypothetical protein